MQFLIGRKGDFLYNSRQFSSSGVYDKPVHFHVRRNQRMMNYKIDRSPYRLLRIFKAI